MALAPNRFCWVQIVFQSAQVAGSGTNKKGTQQTWLQSAGPTWGVLRAVSSKAGNPRGAVPSGDELSIPASLESSCKSQ